MNTIIFIIFLGFIQGVTEFLPISSSGHLALMENLPFFHQYSAEISREFSFTAFNVILHLGTLSAVIIFWKKDLLEILFQILEDLKKGNFNGKGIKKILIISISLIPVLLIPFIKEHIEYTIHSLKWVAGFFILNGTLLIVSHQLPKAYRKKEAKTHFLELSNKSALMIGIFQAIAVLPGISRSGSTITAGLISGLNGKESVRYSFIISIPVLLAAAIFESMEIGRSETGNQPFHWDWLLVGFLSSFTSGYLSLKALVWIGKKTMFYPFGVYTILLGCLIIFFFL